MSDIWVISDTHLNHKNILDFRDELGNRIRPYGSVSQMNEMILERWNSVVKPQDKVYHLGDVAFGPKSEFLEMWKHFNGKKRLVMGNHDDVKFMVSHNVFEKYSIWRQWEDMVFTHVPIHQGGLHTPKRKGLVNVHGHIHHNPSPPGGYINVSCEAIGYTPVHIETLRDMAKELRENADDM